MCSRVVCLVTVLAVAVAVAVRLCVCVRMYGTRYYVCTSTVRYDLQPSVEIFVMLCHVRMFVAAYSLAHPSHVGSALASWVVAACVPLRCLAGSRVLGYVHIVYIIQTVD
jgi:hypothetical protein